MVVGGNQSKYQAMVIGWKHEPFLTAVDINGLSINTTGEVKLLGVTNFLLIYSVALHLGKTSGTQIPISPD